MSNFKKTTASQTMVGGFAPKAKKRMMNSKPNQCMESRTSRKGEFMALISDC